MRRSPQLYLAGVRTQQQAEHLAGFRIVLSYAHHANSWIHRYTPLFSGVLVDSGAYSTFSSGAAIDLGAYAEWSRALLPLVDAVAGLDDIAGDWRQSLRNYEAFPEGFPTIHDTDPPELLGELVALALERKQWLGIGVKPDGRHRNARAGREGFIREVCGRVPDGLHLHGWALTEYAFIRRIDSYDSSGWWQNAHKFNLRMPWLTHGECVDLAVKRLARLPRFVEERKPADLFSADAPTVDDEGGEE